MILSIIIVSFNTKELLGRCLESLFKNPVEGMEIIVVDNGSTDGSVDGLETKYKNIKILRNKENLGFAKANNQAIRQAEGDYVLLLNSDTEVRPGALKKLVEFAKDHSEAGVIGARLLTPGGPIQPSIYYFPSLRRAIGEIFLKNNSYFEKYYVEGNQPAGVEAVVFAAVLIPKKTIEKVGLLDEHYFMYFEDLDYCRRVHNAKLKVYCLPTAEVIHHHGVSGKERNKTYDYSIESSKIYHGKIKFWFLKTILRGIHKWQKISGKK